jgi:bifunctional DNase/RNase
MDINRCSFSDCDSPASVTVQVVDNRRVIEAIRVCGLHLRDTTKGLRQIPRETTRRTGALSDYVVLDVVYYVYHDGGAEMTYFLSNERRSSWLEVCMSYTSGARIDEVLRHDRARSLSVHTSYCNMLNALGHELKRVSIEDASFQNERRVFESMISFDHRGVEVGVPIRVSEAICAAIVGDCPIIVTQKLLIPVEDMDR